MNKDWICHWCRCDLHEIEWEQLSEAEEEWNAEKELIEAGMMRITIIDSVGTEEVHLKRMAQQQKESWRLLSQDEQELADSIMHVQSCIMSQGNNLTVTPDSSSAGLFDQDSTDEMLGRLHSIGTCPSFMSVEQAIEQLKEDEDIIVSVCPDVDFSAIGLEMTARCGEELF